MMNREDAERIAEAISILRPKWQKASLLSMLADHRGREPRDVALALTWLAYDPETRNPGRLREDGPWWHLEDKRPGSQQVPSFRERWAKQEPTTPADPETIQACRARLRGQA